MRNEDWGGGGGGGDKSIHFWKGVFTGSRKISKSEPYELQEKRFCGRSLKFYVTYQPQTEITTSPASLEGIASNWIFEDV